MIPQVIERPVLHKLHHLIHILIPHQTNQITRYINVLPFVGAANVVNVPNCPLEENDLESSRDVLYKEEVASVGTGAMQGDLIATHELVNELRYELLGVLVRAVDVIATSDDNGHAEGAVVGLSEELSAGFGSCVRIGGLQYL